MQLPADSYWTKGLWRNKAFYALMRPPMTLYFRLRNHFHFKRYTPRNKTFLLLTNHNSTVDHFLNAIAVKSYIRFVVSDHLMRQERLEAEERQIGFSKMITLALDTAVKMEEYRQRVLREGAKADSEPEIPEE